MKKLISILLAATMIFTIFPTFVNAEEVTDQTAQANSFHASTIQNMIDVNLELGNIDEEFFHLLANAYLADPVLLAQIISEFNAEEITYLAKAISYDLQKTDRVNQAVLPDDCGSPDSTAVARLIFTEAGNTANASLIAFMDAEMMTALMMPAAEINASQSAYINLQISSAATASVAAPVSVSVTVGSYSTSSSSTTYFYEIHKVVNGVDSVASIGRIIVPANSLGTTVTKSISFNSAGEYVVYAVLLDTADTTIATSSNHSLSVNGKWHITVQLPSNRIYKGTLTLYDASGAQAHQCECLGRSYYGYPTNVVNGDTPTGECLGELGGPVGVDAQGSYGPYKYIRLTPVSGDMKEFTHRSDILIHGGDPETDTSATWYPLRRTYGCVRVSNADQLALQNYIEALIANSNHEVQGTVSITEYTYVG